MSVIHKSIRSIQERGNGYDGRPVLPYTPPSPEILAQEKAKQYLRQRRTRNALLLFPLLSVFSGWLVFFGGASAIARMIDPIHSSFPQTEVTNVTEQSPPLTASTDAYDPQVEDSQTIGMLPPESPVQNFIRRLDIKPPVQMGAGYVIQIEGRYFSEQGIIDASSGLRIQSITNGNVVFSDSQNREYNVSF